MDFLLVREAMGALVLAGAAGLVANLATTEPELTQWRRTRERKAALWPPGPTAPVGTAAATAVEVAEAGRQRALCRTVLAAAAARRRLRRWRLWCRRRRGGVVRRAVSNRMAVESVF